MLFPAGMATRAQGQTRPTAVSLAALRRKRLPVLPPLETPQSTEGEASFQDRARHRGLSRLQLLAVGLLYTCPRPPSHCPSARLARVKGPNAQQRRGSSASLHVGAWPDNRPSIRKPKVKVKTSKLMNSWVQHPGEVSTCLKKAMGKYINIKSPS